MAEKITFIATSMPNLDEQDALKQYVEGVMPLLFAIGGVVITRSLFSQSFLGDKSYTFLFVMDFPSKQKLLDLLESPAYQALIPFRDKGFTELNISLATDMGTITN